MASTNLLYEDAKKNPKPDQLEFGFGGGTLFVFFVLLTQRFSSNSASRQYFIPLFMMINVDHLSGIVMIEQKKPHLCLKASERKIIITVSFFSIFLVRLPPKILTS